MRRPPNIPPENNSRHRQESRQWTVFSRRRENRQASQRLKKRKAHNKDFLPLIQAIAHIAANYHPYRNTTKKDSKRRVLELFGRNLMILGIDTLIYCWFFYAEESIKQHTAHESSMQGVNDGIAGLKSSFDCSNIPATPLIARGGKELIGGLLFAAVDLFFKYLLVKDNATQLSFKISPANLFGFLTLGLKTLVSYGAPENIDPQRYITGPAYCNGYTSGQSLPDGLFGQATFFFALMRNPFGSLVLCYLLQKLSLRQLQKIFDLINAYKDDSPPELNERGIQVEEVPIDDEPVDEQPIPIPQTAEEMRLFLKRSQEKKDEKRYRTKQKADQILKDFNENSPEELTEELLETLRSFLIQPDKDSNAESANKFNFLLDLGCNIGGESSSQLRKIDLVYFFRAFHHAHLRDHVYALFSVMEVLVSTNKLTLTYNGTLLSPDEQAQLLPVFVTHCLTTPLLKNTRGFDFITRFLPAFKDYSTEFSHQFFTAYIERSRVPRRQPPSPFILQAFLSSRDPVTRQAIGLTHLHGLPETLRAGEIEIFNLTQLIFCLNDVNLLRSLITVFFEESSSPLATRELIQFIYHLKQFNPAPVNQRFTPADRNRVGFFLKRGADCFALIIRHLFSKLDIVLPAENGVDRQAILELMVNLLCIATHRLQLNELDNTALLSNFLILNQEFEVMKQQERRAAEAEERRAAEGRKQGAVYTPGRLMLLAEIDTLVLNNQLVLPPPAPEIMRIGLFEKEFVFFCLLQLFRQVGQEKVLRPMLDTIPLTEEDYTQLLIQSDTWLPCVDYETDLLAQDQRLLEHIDALYLNRVKLTLFMLPRLQEGHLNQCARSLLAHDRRIAIGDEPFTHTPGNSLYRLLLITRLRDEELITQLATSIDHLIEQPSSLSHHLVTFFYPSRTHRTPPANLNREKVVELLELLTSPGFLEWEISDHVIRALSELKLLPAIEELIAQPAP